ncbi:DUF4238 domain-containing protein [Xanthomonas arboricola]|uniref:DUF4238 domain-containing protein n=1 Tax=Xanthomonas arboricola TaxID=56448 RepID=UPI0009D7978D|nr:DUF4238 domain-containing protein [Xanthomonas arboricola]PPT56894.1 DUF4238 domain-containing protein [Xanthomonas arboricola]
MKKKKHHYVQKAYLDAWRLANRIFVLNKKNGHCFESTGRNSTAAIEYFYRFSFDQDVVELLRYTYIEKSKSAGGYNIHKIMLVLLSVMNDNDRIKKRDEVIENLYSEIEGRIPASISRMLRLVEQGAPFDPQAFDDLIFLYCLQMMRTPKARKIISDHAKEIYIRERKLDTQQKEDYLKFKLLIDSLALAFEVIGQGCSITFYEAGQGEEFINTDSPVIFRGKEDKKNISGHEGSIPLTPRFMMRVDDIGSGLRSIKRAKFPKDNVRNFNLVMMQHANEYIYFSSENQRGKYKLLIEAYADRVTGLG